MTSTPLAQAASLLHISDLRADLFGVHLLMGSATICALWTLRFQMARFSSTVTGSNI
jgi:hypothetical protein